MMHIARFTWAWVERFAEIVADYWYIACGLAVVVCIGDQFVLPRMDRDSFLPNRTEAVSFTEKRVNAQKVASERIECAKLREEEDVASANLRKLSRLQTLVELHEQRLDEIVLQLKHWDVSIAPLLENSDGKHLAANPESVEVFFTVYETFDRHQVDAMLAGHRLALRTFKQQVDEGQNANHNLSAIVSALAELEKMKNKVVEVERTLETNIRQIDNLKRSDTPTAITLKEASLKVTEAKEAELQKVSEDGKYRERALAGQRELENRDLFVAKATLVGTVSDTYGNSGGPMRLIVGSRKGNRFNADAYYYGKWNYRAHIELEGVVDGNKVAMKTTRIVRNRQLNNGVVWEGTITGDKLRGRWNWTNGRKNEEGEFEFQPEG